MPQVFKSRNLNRTLSLVQKFAGGFLLVALIPIQGHAASALSRPGTMGPSIPQSDNAANNNAKQNMIDQKPAGLATPLKNQEAVSRNLNTQIQSRSSLSAQRNAAQQKYDAAMSKANTAIGTGVTAGTANVAAPINTGNYYQAKSKADQLTPDRAGAKNKSNDLQIRAVQAQEAADKADQSRKASKDQLQKAKDAIRKIIEIERDMSPCLQC